VGGERGQIKKRRLKSFFFLKKNGNKEDSKFRVLQSKKFKDFCD
jgi:hypothetical protein